MSNKKINQTTAYVVFTAISLTGSYMIYTQFLSNYNFGLAFAAFSFIQILCFKSVYLPIQQPCLQLLGVTSSKESENMSFQEALQKRGGLILLSAILGAIAFLVMLPHLENTNAALIFIVSGAIGKALEVPLSIRFFKDVIENKKAYYFGLSIVVIGGLIFQTAGIHLSDTSFDLTVVFAALITATANCFNSLLFRGVTAKNVAREKYVPVKTVSEMKFVFYVLVGLGIGFFVLPNYGTAVRFPTFSEFFALLLIGSIVPICGTIASRLTNELSQSVTRAVEGIRLILGLGLAIVFAYAGGDTEPLFMDFSQKVTGVVIIIIGVYISFAYGKPRPSDSQK